MTTKQTAICEALVKRGHIEVTKYKTSKYRVFTRVDGQFYFVGKNGSLRVGRTISDSFSISSGLGNRLAKEGKQ